MVLKRPDEETKMSALYLDVHLQEVQKDVVEVNR